MTDWLNKAETAMERLIETDRQLAELRTKYERDKRKADRKYDSIFLRVTGNIPERKAQSSNHADYRTTEAAMLTSLLEYEALKNERDTNHLVVEFWKSWQRAKREGQL